MSRIVNRAESYLRAYEAFQQINFSAFDFNTIKESMLDYLKLYFPESFSDYIESSELVALLELFAYLGELVAYRLDVNAHENFITTAERKESVLRLAKLLSYNVNRNVPARGLVKMTSISTTERVFDTRGNDLSNVTVRWNDPNNPNWKEQFLLIMNRVLEQEFGSVLPSDRIQVQDILFELYAFNNNPLNKNVIPFTIDVSEEQFPMEIVSGALDEFGPLERRPEKDLKLALFYLNDGLGDSSDNTGFFLFVKQGEIQRTVTKFDGVTPNQTFDIAIDNSNETDVYVNNIDADSEEVIIDPDDFTADTKLGEWERVDIANSQNIVFNTNPQRNKYEVETLANDQFRLIFGDGKFANIPSGTFEIWSRKSANSDTTIPTSSIQNVGLAFTYQDSENKAQNFAFTFSLIDPIQNSAPSEDLDRIKRIAPSVYFTQDRMVNARDYNEFLLQDNTILKLRAINRTFAGDSKYIGQLFEPNEYYDNVKIFGCDGVFYFNTDSKIEQIPSADLPAPDGGANAALIDALIDNHIQPLLSSQEFTIRFVLEGSNILSIRTSFSGAERTQIEQQLSNIVSSGGVPGTIYITFDVASDLWNASASEPEEEWIRITSNVDDSFTLRYATKSLTIHSDETKFFITNDTDRILTYDTLNTNLDTITILAANIDSTGTDVLGRNYNLDVLKQVIISEGINIGLESIEDLLIIPDDSNGDGFPDDLTLSYLIADDDYVYFTREDTNSPWVWKTGDADTIAAFDAEQAQIDNQNLDADNRFWKRENGREGVNFAWLHRTPRRHLIDPAATNIIDMFIITRGYYRNLQLFLNSRIEQPPTAPTPFQLRNDYGNLLESKMISDTVILHPGRVKIIIGPKSKQELRATIKIIRSRSRSLTANQLKTEIVNATLEFFDINSWEFGETFYFSELSAFIHSKLAADLDSVVLVPKSQNNVFGDLYQVFAREDEIIQPNITVDDIEIVESLDPRILKQQV